MEQQQPVVVEKNGGSGAVIAVLVLVVVALAAWFGYKQGLFTGKDSADQPDIEINLPGTSPAASPAN